MGGIAVYCHIYHRFKGKWSIDWFSYIFSIDSEPKKSSQESRFLVYFSFIKSSSPNDVTSDTFSISWETHSFHTHSVADEWPTHVTKVTLKKEREKEISQEQIEVSNLTLLLRINPFGQREMDLCGSHEECVKHSGRLRVNRKGEGLIVGLRRRFLIFLLLIFLSLYILLERVSNVSSG